MSRGLPPGWARSSVGDLLANGFFTDGDWVESKDQDPDGDIRLLQLADIGEGHFRDRSSRFINEDAADRLNVNFVEPGDVLVARMPDPIGRACLAPTLGQRTITVVDVCILRPEPGIERRWLMWALNSPSTRQAIAALATGTTRKRISRRNLATIGLSVPPLPEQRRIVAAIEEHFSHLDAADASLRNADRRGNGLSRSIFSAANNPVWPDVPLGELLDDIEAGKSFKTPGRPADAEEWGVIKVSAMTWGEFDETENKAVLEVDRVDRRYQIESGDLLLSRANTSELVGATVLVGDCRERLLLSDKSMRLITKPDVDRQWLRYCLGSPAIRAQMSAVATGTSDSMRNISQAKVKALRVRLPKLSVQREIAAEISERLASAKRLAVEADRAARKSAALRRSILAAAFSGQLVHQDPSDEPASVVLERIAAERAPVKPSGKRRQAAS